MQDATTEPLVSLEDVRLTLTGGSRPVNVLRGVNLRLRPGECLSLAGPSGSGKTTLLMVVSGLMRPTGGTVRVAGFDLPGMGEDELAAFRREHVGIVFQDFHLVPTMTALENVALPLEFGRRPDPFGTAREALEAVGLGGRLDHYPAQLSGGEQQRVAIARAFAPRPALLLADEPTGNLDADTGAMVMELIFTLQRDHGATMLLVTHDPVLASRAALRLTLRDGIVSALEGA